MRGRIFEPGMKISEIVEKDYSYAGILREKGIDFCCGGDKSLKQACTETGIDPDEVIQELENISRTKGNAISFSDGDIDSLIKYITETHHSYAKERIPRFKKYAAKVAGVHGSTHPETKEIAQVFNELADEMIPHMQKEELMLFPYIKKLSRIESAGEVPEKPVFGSLAEFLPSMEAEHDHTGEYLHKLESLTDNFNPPEDACQTYRILFSELEEFTLKTMEHVHLENNILFPQAIRIEDKLNKL